MKLRAAQFIQILVFLALMMPVSFVFAQDYDDGGDYATVRDFDTGSGMPSDVQYRSAPTDTAASADFAAALTSGYRRGEEAPATASIDENGEGRNYQVASNCPPVTIRAICRLSDGTWSASEPIVVLGGSPQAAANNWIPLNLPRGVSAGKRGVQ